MFSGFAKLPVAERDRVTAAPLPCTSAAMLATLTEERFSRPDWVFERTWD